MTILVLSLLMLARLVALPILVMFSPIGFAGSIMPFTAGFAKKWWDKLFHYASYGPLATFMLLVAVKVLNETNKLKANFDGIAVGLTSNSGFWFSDPKVLAGMAYFAIPIILFWMAITTAEKMASEASHASIKFGTGASKAFLARMPTAGRADVRDIWKSYKARRSQVPSVGSRWGANLGSLQDRARSVATLGYGSGAREAEARYQQDVAKKVSEAAKVRDASNMHDDELQKLYSKGDRYEKAAAVMELASRGLADARQLNEIRKAFGEKSQITRQMENKMQGYDPAAVFTDLHGKLNENRLKSFVNSNKFDAKKLGPHSLGNAEFMRIAFEEQAISNKDLEELRGRSGLHRKNISDSLEAIADNFTDVLNTDKAIAAKHRNVQMAYLSQTGKFHSSISGNRSIRQEMFKNADKDTLKRVNKAFVDQYKDEIVDNLKAGAYANVITAMTENSTESDEAARTLNDFAQKLTGATGSAATIHNIALNDNRVKNIV
jgi:hypothetical protein